MAIADDRIKNLSYEDIQKLVQELDVERNRFINAFLTCDFDYRRAARAANIANSRALQLLRYDPHCEVIIKWYLFKHSLDTEETLARLSDIARGDIGEFLDAETDPETGEEKIRFNLQRAKQLGKTHLIRKLEIRPDGTVRAELYDATRALETFAKVHKLFAENTTNNYNMNVDWNQLPDRFVERLASGEDPKLVLRDYARERADDVTSAD